MERAQIIAAKASIAAILGFHAVHFANILIRPELDPYWHTISEWSLGPWGWFGRIGWLLGGIGYLALCFSLHDRLKGVLGRIGEVIFAACGLGLIGVGVFVTDPMDGTPAPLTTTGILHVISGMTQLMTFPIAALLMGVSIRRNSAAGSRPTPSIFISLLPLAGLIAFFIHLAFYVIPMGENAHGPDVPIGWPARLLLLTYAAWLITFAVSQINKFENRSE